MKWTSLLPILSCVGLLEAADFPVQTIEAVYTSTAVVLDGKLDDGVWQNATAYPLNVAWGKDSPTDSLSEGGVVRLAWDDKYLYVGARLEDQDVVAESDKDQVQHYKLGDVLEVFLRPPNRRWYWEIFGTPLSRKTVLFFPSRGRTALPSSFNGDMKLQVASTIEGTVNDWKDQDTGWTIEMAVPLHDLTAMGDIIAPEVKGWRILVARYNHSAYHEKQNGELSTIAPSFGEANFHNFDHWADLRFVK